MTTTIAVTGKIPGIGKTSLVVNLAATLAQHFNQRVLVIDFAHTDKLLDQFGYSRRDFRYSLQELIESNRMDVKDHILKYSARLHLLSGKAAEKRDVFPYVRAIIAAILSSENPSWDDRIDQFIPGAQMTRQWLRSILEQFASEYDFILFDSSSSSELLGWCACSLSQLVLIPNGLNLREVREITRTIADIGRLTIIYRVEKQNLKIVRHDTARKEKYENVNYQEVAAGLFLNTQIRESDLLRKKRKSSVKLPVLTHPDSTLAQDYKNLANELMEIRRNPMTVE